MNTRFDMKNSGLMHIMAWLMGIESKKSAFTTFHARNVLMEVDTYEQAKVCEYSNTTFLNKLVPMRKLCTTGSTDQPATNGTVLLYNCRFE
jgi:hypothetical protein